MAFFTLDTNKCRRDGVCADVCVAGIIKNDENRTPFIDEKSKDHCIACGLCVSFCPHDACTVEKLDKTQFVAVNKELKISNSASIQFLKSRRSIRRFKNKTLDDNDLATILDTVRYAPSAKNMQPVKWIVVKGFDKMKSISDLVINYFEECAVEHKNEREVIHYRLLARSYKNGNDVIFRSAPNLAIAVIPKTHQWYEDGAISLTYLELVAHGIGAGCCWAGYFTKVARVYKPLRDLLGLTDDDHIAGAQMLGYPIYKPQAIPSRKNIAVKFIG